METLEGPLEAADAFQNFGCFRHLSRSFLVTVRVKQLHSQVVSQVVHRRPAQATGVQSPGTSRDFCIRAWWRNTVDFACAEASKSVRLHAQVAV